MENQTSKLRRPCFLPDNKLMIRALCQDLADVDCRLNGIHQDQDNQLLDNEAAQLKVEDLSSKFIGIRQWAGAR